jgi:chitin synthase
MNEQILQIHEIYQSLGTTSDKFGLYNSKYGLYQELQFSGKGRLVGVKSLIYYLDSQWLVNRPMQSRNFSILYMINEGLSSEDREKYKLHNIAYPYLQTSPHSATPISLDRWLDNLKNLGFKPKVRAKLVQLLVTILQIGCLEFHQQANNSTSDEVCKVTNLDQLDLISELLGVEQSRLEQSLTSSSQFIGRELCSVVLDPEGCIRQRDQLAAALYSLLFFWIVENINTKFCNDENTANYISLLEQLPQSNAVNGSFSDFIQNLVNEKIHHFTLDSMLSNDKGFREELISDGLQLPDHLYVNFPSANDLLSGPEDSFGMVHIINQQCVKSSQRRSDTKLLTSLNQAFGGDANYIATNPTTNAFTVQHYNSRVAYSVEGFIHDNVQCPSPELIQLFQLDENGTSHSTNAFLVELFSPEAVGNVYPSTKLFLNSAQQSIKPLRQPSRKHAKKPDSKPLQSEDLNSTNLGLVNNTLDEIFITLKASKIWPIININPFGKDSKSRLDQNSIRNQVEDLQLPALATNLSLDLNVSFTFEEYLERYQPVTRSVGLDASKDPKSQVDAFATIGGWTSGSDYVLGNSKVFLSTPKWKDLEDSLRAAIREDKHQGNDSMYLGFANPDDNESIFSGYGPGDVRFRNSALIGGGTGRGSIDPNASAFGLDRPTSHYISGAPRGYGHFGEAAEEPGLESPKLRNIPSPLEKNQKSPNSDDKDIVMNDMSPTKTQHHKEQVETAPLTFARKSWIRITWLMTWWIPTCCIARCGKKRPDIQMAWREKVTICALIFWASAAILFLNIGLGLILCPPKKVFTPAELSTALGTTDAKTYMYGTVYDLASIAMRGHAKGSQGYPNGVDVDTMIENYAGKDISTAFPLSYATYCPGFNVDAGLIYTLDPNQYVPFPFVHSSVTNGVSAPVSNNPRWFDQTAMPFLNNYKVASVVHDPKTLLLYRQNGWASWGSINGKVYDLSLYINYTTSAIGKATANVPGAANSTWLPLQVGSIFSANGNTNQKTSDLTSLWNAYNPSDPNEKKNAMTCLNNVFYVGDIDPRDSAKCMVTNILLNIFTGIILIVTVVKFFSALQLSGKRDPQDYDKFVILQVPCYTESEESVRRTLESLALLKYSDNHKLIFVIADGMIIGSGNDFPTPKIVLNVLGVDPKLEPEPHSFLSIGEGSKQLNYGKIYSGLYEVEGHSVPYLVVVKVGSPKEASRPGNRGKRDSQIILMSFLNRVHFDAPMNPLELEMYHQLKNVIGIDPKLYEYILMVDADTEVLPDSLNRLIAVMTRDASVMGLCGETTIVNENQSITTMMQVYEYYISHHLAKSFESLFGSVTCLPGCFSMYRIKSVRGAPLIIAKNILKLYSENHVDTLHKKNLLSLGEDRYLTTLMLQNFPSYKMKFTPDATCKTVVPEKFDVLLSQRRRWINSTIHNLFELLFLKDMCGFCCFSMRFVVFLDLIGTLILPASVIYMIYIIVAWSTQFQTINLYSILVMAAIYVLQALVFIIKQKWEHIGWMVFYMLAIPLFNFYIPIYSYWHFDDFSWGNTRVVVGDGKKQIITEDDEVFDPEKIPLVTWEEHQRTKNAGFDNRNSMLSNGGGLGFTPGYDHAFPNSSAQGLLNRPPTAQGFSTPASPLPMQGMPQHYMDAGSFTDVRHSYISQQGLPHLGTPVHDSNSFLNIPGYNYQAQNMGTPSQGNLGIYNPQASPRLPVTGQVSDELILQEIRNVLAHNELQNLTRKQIREHLQQVFNQDFSSRKDHINYLIGLVING